MRITLYLMTLALALTGQSLAPSQESRPFTSEEVKILDEAGKLIEAAINLYDRGKPVEAIAGMKRPLEIYRKVYSRERFPDGHDDIASCLSSLGAFYQATGDIEHAAECHDESLAMRRKLFPPDKYPGGSGSLAFSLNNSASLYMLRGQFERAVPLMEEALVIRRKMFPKSTFPKGHTSLALVLNNLGTMYHEMGDYDKAQTYYDEALSMRCELFPKSQYPTGHTALLVTLMSMGLNYDRAGLWVKAQETLENALTMAEAMFPVSEYPNGHPYLAYNLQYLASVHVNLRQYEKAVAYNERALAIRQSLYPPSKFPNGHTEIAKNLNNLGVELNNLRQFEKAIEYQEKSLAMNRLLFPTAKFPDGHPDIAFGLANLSRSHLDLGHMDKAISFNEQSIAMRRKLFSAAKYPLGHPDLASALHNQSTILAMLGRMDEANDYCREAVAMFESLYPKSSYPAGHPDTAHALDTLSRITRDGGNPTAAIAIARRSLTMGQALLDRDLSTASEASAFNMIHAHQLTRDLYVSLTRSDANAEAVYDTLWPTRAIVTRMLEQRHANARAAGTAYAGKLDRLRVIRRRTERLLQDRRMKPSDRDQLLRELADESDRLERELAAAIPSLRQQQESRRARPEDLRKSLPSDTVFVDFMQYDLAPSLRINSKHSLDPRVAHYVAFVIAPNLPTQRIELGPAAPLDQAIRSWREAIERRETSDHAQRLREKVWEPVAKVLRPGTKSVYLSADGDLARLPWVALAGSQPDRVLLEDIAVAMVPHGTFLWEQMHFPRTYRGPDNVLAVGDIQYGESRWPRLPGSLAEINSLTRVAPGPLTSITQAAATSGRLTESLPKSRYAHLATHGEFQADLLAADHKRTREAQETWQVGTGEQFRRVAGQNPLGFVGLVLTNGEVLSGLSILDLNLENLKLVTLSACETGLGEYTGGEGVQGLQRAFHLAGCPNVIASLWHVSDAATAALMSKFYHELWVNHKAPIDALREAQLMVYHYPERIPDLAGERGAPRLKEAVTAKSSDPRAPGTDQKHADTKLWAAFILSGNGR